MTHKTTQRRIKRFARALDAPSLDLVDPVEIDGVCVSVGKKTRQPPIDRRRLDVPCYRPMDGTDPAGFRDWLSH